MAHKPSAPQLADDELEASDMEESGDLSDLQWGDSSLPRTSGRQAAATALIRADRSGRDTPASVDSIPLEWDHDYDLSRGLESPGGRGPGERNRGQEEEDEYLRTDAAELSGGSAAPAYQCDAGMKEILHKDRIHHLREERVCLS